MYCICIAAEAGISTPQWSMMAVASCCALPSASLPRHWLLNQARFSSRLWHYTMWRSSWGVNAVEVKHGSIPVATVVIVLHVKTETAFQRTHHTCMRSCVLMFFLSFLLFYPDDPQVAGTPTFSPVSSPHKGLPPRPPSHSRPPPPQSLEGLRHLHYQRSDYDKSPIKPRMWSESSLDEPYERVKKRSSHSRCAPIRHRFPLTR